MDETAAPAPVPPPRSIGERLRAGRDRSGLSVAAAAEKLHLDPKVIEALEGDRFAELGAPVYVRGHLRRYADFVGETGAEMVASYQAAREKHSVPPPDLTQIPHAERRSDPRQLVNPLIWLGCAAVLLLAIWWVLAGSKSGADKPSVGTPPPASVSNESAGTTAPETITPGGATPVAATTPNPLHAGSAPAATPAANAGPPPKREDAPPTRETRLKLELTNDSWVEIYDARGERLFYDVASGGSVQAVSGRGPLRVVLGNAAGVRVEVDGQSREIPGSAVDGEGARFVVNRTGSLTRAR